jgi:DNA polymerase-3 subunit epsilon
VTSHWIRRELLLLDLETDAPESDEAYLIQAAAIFISPASEPVERVWIAQPRREIPAGAVGVHGISTERARVEGRPVDEVLSELLFMLSYWSPDVPLIGHNAPFDLTVLDREFGRVLGSDLLERGPVVDTLLCDKNLDKYRSGSRQLGDQAKHYGLEFNGQAHDALADARVAGQLAWKLVMWSINNRWPRGRYGPSASERRARALMAADDVAALHAVQVQWHEEGQRGLAEYWRTPKAVDKTWEKVRRGEMTRQEGEAWIAGLPAAADRVEARAAGCWPVVPRVAIVT